MKTTAEQQIAVLNLNKVKMQKDLDDAYARLEVSKKRLADIENQVRSQYSLLDEVKQDYQDRELYLKRTLDVHKVDMGILHQKMEQIQIRTEIEEKKYEYDLSNIKKQGTEIDAELKAKIQVYVHQLRGLQEFQEHRKQLVEQKQHILEVITAERRQQSNEITEIKNRVDSQHEFYQKQLQDGIAEATSFSTKYADLHIDLTTQKIADESKSIRQAYNQSNQDILNALKDNEKLRSQYDDLLKKKKILQAKERILSQESTKYMRDLDLINTQYSATIQKNQTEISSLTQETDGTVEDLIGRLEFARSANKRLQREVLNARKRVIEIEMKRIMREDLDLVNCMSENSIFINTAIGIDQSAPFSATLQKLLEMSKEIENLQIVPRDYSGVDVEVQTDPIVFGSICRKPKQPKESTSRIAPRGTTASRKRKVAMSAREPPAVYKRLFVRSTKMPISAQ